MHVVKLTGEDGRVGLQRQLAVEAHEAPLQVDYRAVSVGHGPAAA